MDAIQILGELQDFLNTRVFSNEQQIRIAQKDPTLNVHLVGQGLAYREVRCFLEHHLKSLKKEKK